MKDERQVAQEMGITRIDCHLYKGPDIISDQSACVAVNPRRSPGSMVVAGVHAAWESIGSQVASKLAIQHFIEAILASGPPDNTSLLKSSKSEDEPFAIIQLEGAFKAANDSVYQFAHRLAAGGRLAASLVGLIIDDGVIVAGRVGVGNAYLCRELEVFPFFENSLNRPEASLDSLEGLKSIHNFEGYLGTQSFVSVELATVPLRPHDVIFITSQELDSLGERELYGLSEDLGLISNRESNVPNRSREPSSFVCEQLVSSLYPEPKNIPFAMVVVVGPETMLLRRSVKADIVPSIALKTSSNPKQGAVKTGKLLKTGS